MNYIYTGSQIVSPEDLQHWKYIRKYRSPKSGKMIYVYADKQTHNILNQKKKIYRKMLKDKKKITDNMLKNMPDGFSVPDSVPVGKGTENMLKQFSDKYWDLYSSKKEADAIQKNADAKLDEYEKMIEKNSVSNLSKQAIDNGKKFIDNLLKKMFK